MENDTVQINYKFAEPKILDDIKKYIDKTYSEHYTNGDPNSPQTFEEINKIPLKGYYFAIGNVQKYAGRCGLKDEEEKELFKIAHYAILSIYANRKMKEKLK